MPLAAWILRCNIILRRGAKIPVAPGISTLLRHSNENYIYAIT
jgi:hypothetical protein